MTDSNGGSRHDDRVRFWKLARAARKLKNRSSKSILSIHHYSPFRIWRLLKTKVLETMAERGSFDASQELRRREKRRAKKEA